MMSSQSWKDETEPATVRLDKWLWAARLFKTRALATTAVDGGKVHLNGARTKPAKHVRPGDTLEIRRGEDEMAIRVVATSDRRGPAPVAQTLYEETPESRDRRRQHAAARALAAPGPHPDTRPSKRDRRALSRLKERR